MKKMQTIKPKSTKRTLAGFTALDLIIVMLAVVFGVVFASVYLIRAPRVRSSRINCVSNLKQIGLAFRMWANENQDKFPMMVSIRDGGTLEYNNAGQVFRIYAALSNELNSPKVLKCAQDNARSMARDWSLLTDQNLSYFVGLNADLQHPEMILSGDRNLTGGVLTNGKVMLLYSNTPVMWTRKMHNKAGNIGMADGSAQQVTAAMLRKQLERITTGPTRIAIP